MQLRHSDRVLFVHQRDYRWRRFGVAQGFDDGEALRVRTEIDDGQIDIVQPKTQNIEGFFLGCSFRASEFPLTG